jgi:hypothetical protein
MKGSGSPLRLLKDDTGGATGTAFGKHLTRSRLKMAMNYGRSLFPTICHASLMLSGKPIIGSERDC